MRKTSSAPAPAKLEPPKKKNLLRLITPGGVSLAVAILALVFSAWQTTITLTALNDQHTATAWEELALPNSGTAEKAHALELIMQNDQGLTGVDLSCGQPVSVDMTSVSNGTACSNRAQLALLDLESPNPAVPHAPPIVTASEFVGANLGWSRWINLNLIADNFGSAQMSSSNFSGSYIAGTSFRAADLEGASFRKTQLAEVDFTGALLYGADFSTSITTEGDYGDKSGHIRDINLSGAEFCQVDCAAEISQAFLDHAFYESDNPPKGLAQLNPSFQIAACKLVAGPGANITMRFCDKPVAVSGIDPYKPPNEASAANPPSAHYDNERAAYDALQGATSNLLHMLKEAHIVVKE